MRRDQWIRLPSYLEVPSNLSGQKAHENRLSITLAPERKEYIDRMLCNIPQEWRLSKVMFRLHGILLPFGYDLEAYNIPNL